MFSIEQRERTRAHLIAWAERDDRIVAAAAVGSSAAGSDRLSDLDLTFGVAEADRVGEVLHDWTQHAAAELDAVHLFDLGRGPSIYRVFLLPGCLQVDLSFTPAAHFGALGPQFELLFGSAVSREHIAQPAPEHVFGLAVHHAVRARLQIERGRLWQAEYWLSGARDEALALAARARGLNALYGRSFDELPPEVHDRFRGGFVGSVDRDELLRALRITVDGLLATAAEHPSVGEASARIEADLKTLVQADEL